MRPGILANLVLSAVLLAPALACGTDYSGVYSHGAATATLARQPDGHYSLELKNGADCQFECQATLMEDKTYKEAKMLLNCENPPLALELNADGSITPVVPRATDPGRCFPWDDLQKIK